MVVVHNNATVLDGTELKTLKNGEDGKFHVMYIVTHLRKKNRIPLKELTFYLCFKAFPNPSQAEMLLFLSDLC